MNDKIPPINIRRLRKKGANKRGKNKEKDLEGQWSVEWLEVQILPEQAWMGIPKVMIPPEGTILFFDSQVLH